jgi:hypothetical protein
MRMFAAIEGAFRSFRERSFWGVSNISHLRAERFLAYWIALLS